MEAPDKLRISNFRCHSELEISLQRGVTLLTGPSGSGKSTIFEALEWCLYGNIRKVAPLGASVRTSVELTTGRFSIYRQNKPGLIRVSIGDKEYEGEIAQSMISRSYGDRKIWESSSYVKQRARCLLLSESNSDKMSILSSMTFTEDPTDNIKKVKFQLDRTSAEMKSVEAERSSTSKLLSYLQEICTDRPTLTGTKEEMIQMHDKLTLELRSTKDALSKQERLLGKLELAQNEYKSASQRLLDLDSEGTGVTLSAHEERLRIVYGKLMESSKINTEVSQALSIESELSKLPESPKSKHAHSSIISVGNIEESIQRNKKICAFHRAEYNRESVDSKIDQIRSTIDEVSSHLDTLRKESKKESLRESMSKLGSFETTTKEDISKIKAKLSLAKVSLDVLKCPDCEANLKHEDGKLVLSESARTNKDVVRSIEKELRLAKSEYNKTQRYENISAMLANDNLCLAPDPDEDTAIAPDLVSKIKSHEAALAALSSVEIFEQPEISSSEMMRQNQAYGLSLRLSNLTNRRTLVDIETLRDERNVLAPMISELSKMVAECESLKRRIGESKEVISSITIDTSLESKVSRLTRDTASLKDSIDKFDTLRELIRVESEMAELDTRFLKLTEDLSDLGSIMAKGRTIYTRMLEENCDLINSSLQSTLSLLFKQPISVKLLLTKKLKNGMDKHQVNISITYKGSEYDNIRQVSGGEGDRISLAMALALSGLSRSPFILLDEVTPSLDEEVRSKCRSVLSGIRNKFVILIGHNEVEGAYDRVIRMD